MVARHDQKRVESTSWTTNKVQQKNNSIGTQSLHYSGQDHAIKKAMWQSANLRDMNTEAPVAEW